jgi:hypothetical protein
MHSNVKPARRWPTGKNGYYLTPSNLILMKAATVKGRRHYTPQELKALAAIERRIREDDHPPKRKKIRARP